MVMLPVLTNRPTPTSAFAMQFTVDTGIFAWHCCLIISGLPLMLSLCLEERCWLHCVDAMTCTFLFFCTSVWQCACSAWLPLLASLMSFWQRMHRANPCLLVFLNTSDRWNDSSCPFTGTWDQFQLHLMPASSCLSTTAPTHSFWKYNVSMRVNL